MEKHYLNVIRGMIINAKKEVWREDKFHTLYWLDMAKSFIDETGYIINRTASQPSNAPDTKKHCKCILWNHNNHPLAHDKDCPEYPRG